MQDLRVMDRGIKKVRATERHLQGREYLVAAEGQAVTDCKQAIG